MTDALAIAKMRGEAVFELVHKVLCDEAWRIRSFEDAMLRLGLTPSRDRDQAAKGLDAAAAMILHILATGQDMRLDGGVTPPWVKTKADEDRWRIQVKTTRELLSGLAGQARSALAPKTEGEEIEHAAAVDGADASQDSAPPG